ncbi:MAG: hypothetical protein WBP59_17940 [Ilumatobacteraceae bacterium]
MTHGPWVADDCSRLLTCWYDDGLIGLHRRPADLERLLAAGDCLVIMTSCESASSRVVERNLSDRFVANRAVLDAAGVGSVEEHTDAVVARMLQVEREMLVDFAPSVPVLRVDTTHGYDPDMDAILAFAIATRDT